MIRLAMMILAAPVLLRAQSPLVKRGAEIFPDYLRRGLLPRR